MNIEIKEIIKYILFLLLFSLASLYLELFPFYKKIILDESNMIIIITLVAGLFGFMIAIIPFAMQLLNKGTQNEFLKKLIVKSDFYIEPMFNRFISLLYIMLVIILYFLIINVSKAIGFGYINDTENWYKIVIIISMYIYIVLIFKFILMLKNTITDLKSLIYIFFHINKF